MENLQKLVPFFQELLKQWYDLTLHNQEYAICLALSVWLVTAIFYSIRIGFLKRHATQLAVGKHTLQTQLDETNIQLQTLQQQLAEVAQQVQAAEQATQAETERADGILQNLNNSNQQLASSLANLVTSFELNQPNLPAADSANLLTEYNAILGRVVERFQNEQQAKTQLQLSMHAETAKLAEKDVLIDSLQSRLDNQTQQLAKLELANEEYQTALRQLEIDKQNLNAALQQRQAESVRAVEVEKTVPQVTAPASPVVESPRVEPVIVSPVAPVTPVAETPVPEVAAPVAKAVEIPKPLIEVKPAPAIQAAPAAAKPETKPDTPAKPKPAKADGGKLKGIFGRAMEKISKMDEKLGFESNPKPTLIDEAEDNVSEVLEKTEQAIETVAANVTKSVEEVVVETKAEPAKNDNKLSGMFGKLKFKK